MQALDTLMEKQKPWIVGSLFLIALIGLNLRAKPQWVQPNKFDAYSYIAMSENIVNARDTVPEHHWQRLFGPIVVKGLHTIFGIDHRVGFRLMAITGFSILGLLLYIFFWKLAGDPWFGFSGSLIILMAQYPLRYTLENFYQVCDLYTYLFTLVILISLIKRNLLLFFIISYCAILTRQNMIFLAGIGTLYFLIKGGLSVHQKSKTSSLMGKIKLWCLNENGWVIMVGGAIQLCEILLLFYFSKKSGAVTLGHLKFFIRYVYAIAMIKVMLSFAMPFTFVFVLHWKKILTYSIRYYPVALFSLLTIYQPFSTYNKGGYYNATRIAMQGLWLWQFVSLVAIGSMISNYKNSFVRIFVYALPVTWLIPLIFKSTRLFQTPPVYLSTYLMVGITIVLGLLTWDPILKLIEKKEN